MDKIKLKTLALTVRDIVQRKVQQAAIDMDAALGAADDLAGTCGYASWALWQVLPGSHLVLGEWDGYTHAWVEYDGYIVDITATQFGAFARVRLLLKTSKRASLYYREHMNSDAEDQVTEWYPVEWRDELTRLLEEAGVLQHRRAA